MFITGCQGGTGSPENHAELSARQQQLLEEHMPDLARSIGAHSLSALHEQSCRKDAPVDALGQLTSWKSQAAVHVPDRELAHEVGASVRAQAEKQGWQTLPEDEWRSGGGEFVYQADDPDHQMRLTAYDDTDRGRSMVVLLATTACLEMPEGNRLTYSTLDPAYGEASIRRPEVEDVHDAAEHPRGRKPLPASTQTPPPTGPTGATPVRFR